MKRKRDILASDVTPTKRNSLTDNVGSGDGYTVEYSSSEGTAKGKNKNKEEEENDWIIGNADILKSKEVKPHKSKNTKSSKSSSKTKLKKKPKHEVNKKKYTSPKDHLEGSEGTGNKKSHQNHDKEKSSDVEEDDWIYGSTDVITEYLNKKKELEQSLKKKDDLIATNSGSGSGEGSGSGSGEFQYTVKPYVAPTEENEISHHQDGQKNSDMAIRESTNVKEDFPGKVSNQTLLKDLTGHQQDELPKTVNQTLLKDLIRQQDEARQHEPQQMESYRQPETLKELVAPLQTTNISQNASTDLMNHLADKVVENPNLRNDYLFQLTHQEPVGLVGTHNEVDSVTAVGGGSVASSSVMTGSVRGEIQGEGEDDKEV